MVQQYVRLYTYVGIWLPCWKSKHWSMQRERWSKVLYQQFCIVLNLTHWICDCCSNKRLRIGLGNVRCLADTGHSQFRLRSLDGQVDGYQFMWRSVEITEKLIFELWFYDSMTNSIYVTFSFDYNWVGLFRSSPQFLTGQLQRTCM